MGVVSGSNVRYRRVKSEESIKALLDLAMAGN